MNSERSPWSHPDPRWQPQSYQDAPGRDPKQPFLSPRQSEEAEKHSIEDFRKPKSGGPPWWLWAIAVLVAAVLLLVVLQIIDPEDSAGPIPGASDPDGTSIPFEGNGDGVFEILDQEWDGNELTVDFQVTVEDGESSFEVYMFNNESMEVSYATEPAVFKVSSDAPYKGTAKFFVERGRGTFVLTSNWGAPLTALPIQE